MSWKPKSEPISFRVTKEKYKELEAIAENYGLKMSRFMDEKVTEFYLEAVKSLPKKKRDQLLERAFSRQSGEK